MTSCLIGVFSIIIKGDLNLLINLKFTSGDLWMLASAIGWALYSIYLFYWKTKLPIIQRFALVAFFGAVSLFPFYIIEEFMFQRTAFYFRIFFLGNICSSISRYYCIYFSMLKAQEKLGASLTGFTLYIFTVYAAIYGFYVFDEKLEIYHLHWNSISIFWRIFS